MEIPPAPIVACGMVRRAWGEKGKQGRRGVAAVAGDGGKCYAKKIIEQCLDIKKSVFLRC